MDDMTPEPTTVQCACRFEWRETPDFSGKPPLQLDECGYHAVQRDNAEKRCADMADYALRLERSLQMLVDVIHDEELIPESMAYMKQARAALASKPEIK